MAKKTNPGISEEAELESAYRDLSGHSENTDKRPRRKTALVAILCVAAVVAVLCTVASCLYFPDPNGTILENVSVAGVDVGGMTQEQAITAVTAATENTYTTTPMTITVMESEATIPVDHVGTLNVRRAVRAAYKFGNSGSSEKRQSEQQIAATSGYIVDLEPYLDVNKKAILEILSQLGAKYSHDLTQTTYQVTGTAPTQALVIKLGVPEYGLDMEQLYRQVMETYNANQFQVTGKYSMIEPDPINLDAIYQQYYVAPTDAYFDKNAKQVVKEVDGYAFDLESAKTQVAEATYGTTVTIPFTAIKAEVTEESLSSVMFKDTLGSYSATASSSKSRNTNLRIACEALNGVVLYPGEVFSYNDTLGERTPEKGYKPAPSYSGGETVLTYGGGICQVSSVLYCSTLKAELKIVSRTNHGYMPGYMKIGLDATVNWGTIDFKFENSLEYPIKIVANASGGKVSISILGTEYRDYRVELDSKILSTTGYDTIYRTMSPNNSEGYEDGDFIVTPYRGYKAESYMLKYDNESGDLISKTVIATSRYNKRDAVVCRIEGAGTGDGGTGSGGSTGGNSGSGDNTGDGGNTGSGGNTGDGGNTGSGGNTGDGGNTGSSGNTGNDGNTGGGDTGGGDSGGSGSTPPSGGGESGGSDADDPSAT